MAINLSHKSLTYYDSLNDDSHTWLTKLKYKHGLCYRMQHIYMQCTSMWSPLLLLYRKNLREESVDKIGHTLWPQWMAVRFGKYTRADKMGQTATMICYLQHFFLVAYNFYSQWNLCSSSVLDTLARSFPFTAWVLINLRPVRTYTNAHWIRILPNQSALNHFERVRTRNTDSL